MKKKLVRILATATAISMIPLAAGCGTDDNNKTDSSAVSFEAVYLGVVNESEATRADVLDPGSKVYRFLVGDEEKVYSLDEGTAEYDSTGKYLNVKKADEGAYPIQNELMKGCSYEITVKDDEVTGVKSLEEKASEYKPAVTYSPGKKTLKNFLTTCLAPMGTTNYVYGGGWDFQDTGASNQARTIGVSEKWTEFFDYNDADYIYNKTNKDGINYCPENKWNTYYYYGLDCSGYVGWSVYNLMNTKSLAEPGYVVTAGAMANYLAEERNLGSYDKPEMNKQTGFSTEAIDQLRPGDIISTTGEHVYIVIGKCNDDSIVIVHATVTNIGNISYGSGVQLGFLNADGSNDYDCEAYELADEYMKKYYPKWSERYNVTLKYNSDMLDFSGEDSESGIFHWDLNGVLKDDEGYSDMSAEEVLEDLFKDASAN